MLIKSIKTKSIPNRALFNNKFSGGGAGNLPVIDIPIDLILSTDVLFEAGETIKAGNTITIIDGLAYNSTSVYNDKLRPQYFAINDAVVTEDIYGRLTKEIETQFDLTTGLLVYQNFVNSSGFNITQDIKLKKSDNFDYIQVIGLAVDTRLIAIKLNPMFFLL